MTDATEFERWPLACGTPAEADMTTAPTITQPADGGSTSAYAQSYAYVFTTSRVTARRPTGRVLKIRSEPRNRGCGALVGIG